MAKTPRTKLLTVQEAAEELGVSEQRIRKLIGDGRIKATRHGRRTYSIKPRDLEAFERLTGPQGGRSPRVLSGAPQQAAEADRHVVIPGKEAALAG